MAFQVALRPAAVRDLRRLDSSIRGRVIVALRGFETDPSPPAATQLKGYPELRRIRVGDHRIIYSVESNTVRVHRIRHRRDVYRRLDGLE